MQSYRIDKANSAHTSLISLAVHVCFLTMCFPLLLLLQALNFPRILTLPVIRSYIKSIRPKTSALIIMDVKCAKDAEHLSYRYCFSCFFLMKSIRADEIKNRLRHEISLSFYCILTDNLLLSYQDVLNLWIIISIIHYLTFVTKVYHVSNRKLRNSRTNTN